MTGVRRTEDHHSRRMSIATVVAAIVSVLTVLGAVLVLALVVLPPPSVPSASIHQLLEQVRADYPEIYDADRALGTADDLTPAKLDLILRVSNVQDPSADSLILQQLTAVILDLVSAELGQETNGVPICRDGGVDVTPVPGATDVFGGDRPTIGGIVADVTEAWTGTLGSDAHEWTFGYDDSQRQTVDGVLSGMSEGRLIVSSGCPGV